MTDSYNFKNSILIIVFNFSNCIKNKDILNKIYKNHFKEIIFYSDFPIIEDNEINFIDINKGWYTCKVFNHFYKKYKSNIDNSDGIFYTMDDNIININILNLLNNNRIILPNCIVSELDFIENKNGWWWDHFSNNKEKIITLNSDNRFKKYNINKYSGGFSDFFYLPKKYLTNTLFELFEIFSKYEIFLEITIPTIINNIETDKTEYNTFKNEILWGEERNNYLNEEYIYNSLNHNHNLFLHPIKFNQNPDSKIWLEEFFCKEKCVIITTINKPTETIIKHINNNDYDVIIVGDNKTPDDYKKLKCIYLDIDSQNKLFPELSEMLPLNHYCRKNLGYLYAIKKGYKIIYETDDDNIPYDNFDNILQYNNIQMITEQNSKWINIFKYFTNNAYIWPRGFPLSLLKNEPKFSIENTDIKPSIINGLVENDPDVDALFRIICNHQTSICWEKDKNVLINNKNVCVFNTQNTFWINPEIFICLLIPSSVSFRYCDILRGIITNIILKETNNYMMYSSPNVIQKRNEHDLISDFKSEYEMYIHNEYILNILDIKNYKKKMLYMIQSSSKLPEIYECLKNKNFVLLSYKENTPETNIFYPNSTWTTGRNKLREYALNLNEKYDYYIFLDEDVVFTNYNQYEGFEKFEELICNYEPDISNPKLDGYYYNNYKGEVQTTIWFVVCAMHFPKLFFFPIYFFLIMIIFIQNHGGCLNM